jgi:hypothetical protein
MSNIKQAAIGIAGGLVIAAIIISGISLWSGTTGRADYEHAVQAIVDKGLAVEFIDPPETMYRKDVYWFTGISVQGKIRGTAERKLDAKGHEVWEVTWRKAK